MLFIHFWGSARGYGGYRVDLANIPLGRQKDPCYINVKNPTHQKMCRIPNIDPGYAGVGVECLRKLVVLRNLL